MEQSSDNNSSHENLVWIGVLFFICIGLVVYSYMYSKNSVVDIPYLMGKNSVYCLFIGGVFHSIFGKNQSKVKVIISFSLIFLTLIVGDLFAYSKNKIDAVNAINEIQKDYLQIANSATDANGAPQVIKNKLDTTSATKGDMGEVVNFTKNMMNSLASDRNSYLIELEAIGWNKIFDTERLKKDDTLSESKLIIERAKETVKKYREKSHDTLTTARNDIEKINVDEYSKKEFIRGFDSGLQESRAKYDSLWDLENESVLEFEKIIRLLLEKKGAWEIQNGQIAFANDSDLAQFNSYLEAIQAVVSKQEAIQKQSYDETNKRFDALKN